MGKTIMIKNNKGGVGKTFLTCQLAYGLALIGKKTLILTTDSQNDVLEYVYKTTEIIDKNGNATMTGLKAEVNKRGSGDKFPLMQNLTFIPLESESFGPEFIKKIPNFLEEIKNEYEYIIIDSAPDLKIDETFVKNTDYMIIPLLANNVSLQSALKLVNRMDSKKILGFIINMYDDSATDRKYFNFIKENLNNILAIIPNLSFIKKMLDNRKTVWNYTNKDVVKLQMQFYSVLRTIEDAKEIRVQKNEK